MQLSTERVSQREFESTTKSTRKGVNQLHNEYIESASKTRRLRIIKRRLGSIKGNYRTTRVEYI
jgi:hypothetical protein